MSGVRAPILAVRNLSVRRGNLIILDRIAWTVAHREHWVVLGANGSGKTSLLGALTGYLSPTAGSVQVLGEEFGASDWRDLRRHVGIVSSSVRQLMYDDEPALVTVASGKYGTIGHWGRLPEADLATARRLLARVECASLAGRPWLVLSQGERQRVLIARALMARPRLLILDEPCAGLDPVAREQFLAFIERLAAQKAAQKAARPALVLVTHHVEEIMPSFTHALLLRAGGVVAAGPRAQVLTGPQLSTTFAAPLQLRRAGGRYTLRLRPSHSTRIT